MYRIEESYEVQVLNAVSIMTSVLWWGHWGSERRRGMDRWMISQRGPDVVGTKDVLWLKKANLNHMMLSLGCQYRLREHGPTFAHIFFN